MAPTDAVPGEEATEDIRSAAEKVMAAGKRLIDELAAARASPPPSAPLLEAVPARAEPAPRVDTAPDNPDRALVKHWDWRQLLEAWARIRLEGPEDVRPEVKPLFAADLKRFDAEQWETCLRRYALTTAAEGLHAAAQGHPLRLLRGSTRSERMPPPRPPGWHCCKCRQPAEPATAPNGRPLCGSCAQRWWARFQEDYPVPAWRWLSDNARAERTAEELAENERQREAHEAGQQARDGAQQAHFEAWLSDFEAWRAGRDAATGGGGT